MSKDSSNPKKFPQICLRRLKDQLVSEEHRGEDLSGSWTTVRDLYADTTAFRDRRRFAQREGNCVSATRCEEASASDVRVRRSKGTRSPLLFYSRLSNAVKRGSARRAREKAARTCSVGKATLFSFLSRKSIVKTRCIGWQTPVNTRALLTIGQTLYKHTLLELVRDNFDAYFNSVYFSIYLTSYLFLFFFFSQTFRIFLIFTNFRIRQFITTYATCVIHGTSRFWIYFSRILLSFTLPYFSF